jgi:hypothetical protein
MEEVRTEEKYQSEANAVVFNNFCRNKVKLLNGVRKKQAEQVEAELEAATTVQLPSSHANNGFYAWAERAEEREIELEEEYETAKRHWRGKSPDRTVQERILATRRQNIRGVGLSLRKQRPQSAPPGLVATIASAAEASEVIEITTELNRVLSQPRVRPVYTKMTMWKSNLPTTMRVPDPRRVLGQSVTLANASASRRARSATTRAVSPPYTLPGTVLTLRCGVGALAVVACHTRKGYRDSQMGLDYS